MGVRSEHFSSWLTSLGLLEQNEFFSDGSLLEYLHNCSVLCHLLNLLRPGLIHKIFDKPSSEEERVGNFRAFLNGCQEIGVNSEEVFTLDDLESEDGKEQVLRTLEILENAANDHGILGSPSLNSPERTLKIETNPTKAADMSEFARGGGVRLVKATFPFEGTDEDEICFAKGDILEVTKVVDGGWWEGTLNGKNGWFPSNYVKEISASPEIPVTPTTPIPLPLSATKRDSTRVYHNLVVQNILDTERAHVSELQALLQNYLKPLQYSNILSPRDLKVLCGNFEELVRFQQTLFGILDECAHLPLSSQRIGANFLQIAPQMKELYLTYCANHPRAVEVLTKYSDELSAFIESKGAPAPGILTLTTSLSKPFCHLDKYPTLLKELERHLEDGHIDELDTKKAIPVFQNIKTSCNEMRKKKETELEILTGTIEGLDQEEINKLGDVILMAQFLIHGDEGEVRERYFLLFSSCLIILSVSAKLSGFCFERKYDISNISVRSLEDTEGILNAFEIKANGDVMKLSTNHAPEKAAWMETLPELLGQSGVSPTLSDRSPWEVRHGGQAVGTDKPSPPRNEATGSPPGSATLKKSSGTMTGSQGSDIVRTMSTSHSTEMTAIGSVPSSPQRAKRWDISKLRPTPPLRPAYALMAKEPDTSMGRSVKGLLHATKKKQDFSVMQCFPHGCLTISPLSTFKTCTADCRAKSEITDDERNSRSSTSTGSTTHVLEEDMLILRVIESYCTSARARQTLNSSPIIPQVPPHARTMSTSSRGDWKRKSKKKQNREENSIAPDEIKKRPESVESIGSQKLRNKESKKFRRSRNMDGDITCLRKKVEELQSETHSLRESLLEEQQARRNMEKFIRTSLRGIVPDIKWEEFKESF
ncbi:rho guanine nucleotide exchange factor 7 isoform X4 [Nematostella vectensis]|uniref:rho guanine nucleotide exchange factor 7 isoform X4 n=1 Tax=Nematostella vectensis TaxID=45351 RepID=UPI0013903A72|nr:rho guanine nucleotide exchange factor 7 isoform X4 [Nematostella vectensis]